MNTQSQWYVETDGETVVVELPAGLELDESTSKAINEAFAEQVSRPGADSVLTLLSIDNALSRGVFDEVKKGADLAAAEGIDKWAIVVNERIKGMAFDSNIDGLETTVFEDEADAREWVNQ